MALKINGLDAAQVYGVSMGKGFVDALTSPLPVKEYIENTSRLSHGKRVVPVSPMLDERELTLQFVIRGVTKADYLSKKREFLEVLYAGFVAVEVDELGSEVYNLLYMGKNISYAQNTQMTMCRISAKFCEPNPSNRSYVK